MKTEKRWARDLSTHLWGYPGSAERSVHSRMTMKREIERIELDRAEQTATVVNEWMRWYKCDECGGLSNEFPVVSYSLEHSFRQLCRKCFTREPATPPTKSRLGWWFALLGVLSLGWANAAECHVTKHQVWMVCQLRDCDDGSSCTVPAGTMPVIASDGSVIWVVREK